MSLKDRPILPALLSMSGIALPLYLLVELVLFLVLPQPPPPEGGVGPYYGPLLLIPLIPVFFVIVVLPFIFSLLLLFEPSRHKTWATVLIVWWGLASAYLGGGAIISSLTSGGSTSAGNFSWLNLTYTAGSLTPFLALVGTVWGYYWHTCVNPRNWTPRRIAESLCGPAGYVRLAAIASFVSSLFASPVLAIAPFLMLVGAVRLRNNTVRSRGQTGFLIAASVANLILLLAFEYVEYRNAWWEIGPRVAGFVSLAAGSLAVFELVVSMMMQTAHPDQMADMVAKDLQAA